jgi:hypothetical protein
MRASIVVLNYNYGRFVAQAIDSALAQTERDVEVVVVDNGSTDDSPEVIARYGDRVRVVRQPINVGQGRGYNLGFEAARGEWLVWLDADDLLDPECIATCLSVAGAGTAKVHFGLRLVDADGVPLGGEVTATRHSGDVVPLIRRFGHYAGPPGSGNLYRRSAVAPYFPVPVADWPIGTDTVPYLTAPFHGTVADAGRVLGSYRLHRKAAALVPGYIGNYVGRTELEVELNRKSREQTLALLRERSGIDVPPPPMHLAAHVRHRISSWRRAGADHPHPDDRAFVLWRMMAATATTFPGYSLLERIALIAWATGAIFLPRGLAERVIAMSRSSPLWMRMNRLSGRH